MAIAEVLQKLHFVNAAPSSISEIEQTIKDAYAGSDTARQMFDLLVDGNQILTFTGGNENKADGLGQFRVEFNVAAASSRSVISSNGTIWEYGFRNVMLHEIIHAVVGSTDYPEDAPPANLTRPGYDYIGDTVRNENLIYHEMGQSHDRSSYYSTIFTQDIGQLGVQQGESLTHGASVGVTICDTVSFNEINTTDRADDTLLIGLYGNDTIKAGAGDDFLYGGDGEDQLIGGDGTDLIYGNAENDTLIGGTSEGSDGVADYLTGGGGSDSFYVDNILGASQTFSYDTTIHDYKYNQDVRGTFDLIRDFTSGDHIFVTVEEADWLGLNRVDFSDYALRRAPFDYGGTPVYSATTGKFSLSAVYDTYVDPILKQSITVLLFFEAELKTAIFGIETSAPTTIHGSGGNDALTGTAASDAMFGEEGDDALAGGDSSDELTGGKGNDSLNGGRGSDTYHYARSDGNDVISDGADNASRDFLLFSDLDLSDLTITKSGNDLIITVDETSETITLQNQYNSANEPSAIEIIQFAGGGVLELDHSANTSWSNGTSAADVIQGGSGKDYIVAGEGADEISGGEGGDVYIYREGDGSDTINDGSASLQDIDVLQLIDLWDFQVTLERDGNDLQVIVDNGDIVTIKDQFRTDSLYWGIERIEFADGSALTLDDIMEMFPNIIDGTSGDDSLIGTNGNDSLSGLSGDDQFDGMLGNDHLYGGLGNDLLNGGEGSDVYHYTAGDGNDTISDIAINLGDVDVLSFSDLNIGDLTISRSGEEMLIAVNSTGEVITVETQFFSAAQGWALEKLKFADGTSLELDHMPDTSWIYGTNASETIDGNWGKDYVVAGKGDDIINGSAGGDVYIYASGDGSDIINDDVGFTDAIDVLRFSDIVAYDLSLVRRGDDLELTIGSTGDVITLQGQMREDPGYWGIDKIEFSNGDVWDRKEILLQGQSALDAVTVEGTTGDDVLVGTAGHDYFEGNLGNDVLYGGNGSDTYLYWDGDGTDYIDDEANATNQVDILEFADLNPEDISAERDGVNLKLTVLGSGETITIDEQFVSSSEYWGIEGIEFADGTFWDRDVIMSIGEGAPNLVANQFSSFGSQQASSDIERPSAEIIEFPAASIDVTISDRALALQESGQVATTSGDFDGGTAEIISLTDFLSASEHSDAASDLWYEPEPIGAVI